jgi:hypothetical protein
MKQEAVKEILTEWEGRARESQFAHYALGDYYFKINRSLGIIVVFLSSSTGALGSVLLGLEVPWIVKLSFNAVSTVTAILVGLQAFLRLGERAEKYRVIGAQYGNVRREIDVMRCLGEDEIEELERQVRRIKERLIELATESPGISQKVLEWTKRQSSS